jgi:hypothetical protein
MLDRDLAELYGVDTRVLNQAVKRNLKRFPDDFMFQMTREELKEWKSQIVISLTDARLRSLLLWPIGFFLILKINTFNSSLTKP